MRMLPGGSDLLSCRARTALCTMRCSGSRSSAPSHCSLLRRMSPPKSKVVVYSLPSSWCGRPVIVARQPVFQARIIFRLAGVRSQASLPCLAIIAMLVLYIRTLESTVRFLSIQMWYIWLNLARPCARRTRMAWSVVASCSW